MQEPWPRFSVDWFTQHIPNWERYLAVLKGRPRLYFVEIGSYEGRATLWLLQNILTHPTSRIMCIDIFGRRPEYDDLDINMEHLYERFLNNIYPYLAQVDVRKGFSHEQLRELSDSSCDFIYVDGAHTAMNALEDMVLGWRLLKPAGIMCVDDYGWDTYVGTLNHPKQGIDAFLACYEGRYELLHKDYQVFLGKQ